MWQCGKPTIDRTPKICLEKTAAVGVADFIQTALDRYARIIYRGVDAAKTVNCLLSRDLHFFAIGGIGNNIDGLAPSIDFFCLE